MQKTSKAPKTITKKCVYVLLFSTHIISSVLRSRLAPYNVLCFCCSFFRQHNYSYKQCVCKYTIVFRRTYVICLKSYSNLHTDRMTNSYVSRNSRPAIIERVMCERFFFFFFTSIQSSTYAERFLYVGSSSGVKSDCAS